MNRPGTLRRIASNNSTLDLTRRPSRSPDPSGATVTGWSQKPVS